MELLACCVEVNEALPTLLVRSRHIRQELSPTFLQFIECVWQISQQLPHAFEFNSRYLAELMHLAVSCEHGTFLCNCERQRVMLDLHARTTSAWDALSGPEFLNPDFIPKGGWWDQRGK